MAVLTAENLPVAGGVPTYAAAAAGGDEAETNAGRFVVVKNAAVAAITATFTIPVGVNAAVSIAKTVPASGEVWMPIPQRNHFPHGATVITASSGATLNPNASWTYSAVTSVTVAVVQAP